MKKLFIITNEKIFENEGKYYCDNIDSKSTPEGLNNYFDVNLIGRRSIKKRSHEIKISNIKTFKSFFLYLNSIATLPKFSNSKFLIISITPYTLFAYLILKIFRVTPYVYLRSDGYGEYKAKFGLIGKFIYHVMFTIVSYSSNLISCREYILNKKKGSLVYPSQLDQKWFLNIKKAELGNLKMLYVGRIRVEKGIFSLLKIIEGKNDIFLTIVGEEYQTKKIINQSNVKVFENTSDQKQLIKFYDECNIFILPSFTEGHPMVLLEALARKRPVIIFKEIEHVVGDKKGIFISDRNFKSLFHNINHIKENYEFIIKEMDQNKLPTKKNFNEEIQKIINK